MPAIAASTAALNGVHHAMPWVFLALAMGCLAIAMKSQSMSIALIALLASLGFMLFAALGWISGRIQGRTQPAAAVLTPDAIALIRKARERQDASAAPAAEADDDGAPEHAVEDGRREPG
jgi:hypothetical protein